MRLPPSVVGYPRGHTSADGTTKLRAQAVGTRTTEVAPRSWWAAGAIGGCGAIAAALRLPYLAAGLTPDEGGYAYVARQWAKGARLYDEAWADRPQGLLVAFRLLVSLAAEPWAVRLGAVVCGTAITVLLGVIGWQLRGPATGVVAAAIYAVVGVGPRVNGFAFNGELAAAVPAAGAVAAALAWRGSGRRRWLVVAGFAGGTAVLMKQSGFDGLVVAAVVVGLATEGRARRRALAVLAGSAVVPLLASMAHGAIVGWDRYWFAVVGYRAHSQSARIDVVDRAGRFFATADDAARDLGIVLLLAVAALVVGRIRRDPVVVPAVWLGAAFAGFNLGALYWRHYYVQLIPPLTLLAAMAVTTLVHRVHRSLAVCLAMLPVAAFLAGLWMADPGRRDELIPHRRQFEDHERIAVQLHARARPGDAIYALVSEPDLYFAVDLPSRYPYLWGHPVLEIPGARERLRALLASSNRPEWLAIYTPPHEVDPSGRLSAVIRRFYVQDHGIESRQSRLYRARTRVASVGSIL